MSKQQGFILLSVLLMIALLTVLLFSQLQLIVLNKKLLNLQHSQQLVFREMETELNHIIAQASDLQEGQYTVSVKDHVYAVHIENAGSFPCLPIVTKRGALSSHHWIIQLQAMSEKKERLDVRFATMENTSLLCKQVNPRPIKPGLQSWHFYSG